MNAAMKQTRNPGWPLIFLTHAAAGLFFAYETAGALGPDLAVEMGFTDHQIGLLYSAYSIPAFVSIFVNGFLNKKFGAPKCVVLLSFIIAIGVSIIAAAPNFYTMFIGQLIYGTGASPMFLTTTIITGKWFGTDLTGKKKISIVVGLQFAWMRFHSFAAFVSLPLIAELDFRLSLCSAAFVCWGCFASGVVFYFVDKSKRYTENVFDAVELKDVSVHSFSHSDSDTDSNSGDEADNDKETTSELGTSTEIPASPQGDATLSVKLKEAELENVDVDGDALVENKPEGEQKRTMWTKDGRFKQWYQPIVTGYKTIRGFSVTYWLVLSLLVIFTCDLYTTTAFLTKYLMDMKMASTDARASFITSLVCLANVITAPIAGWFSGYTGWRVKLLILGSINLMTIHAVFAFTGTNAPAIVLASALGLTQSIMDTNLWPALIFTVPKKDYPFGSSLVTLSYNLGLIIFPTFCGVLRDMTDTWLSVNLTFMAVAGSSVVLSCMLKLVDLKNGSILDLPFIKQPAKA